MTNNIIITFRPFVGEQLLLQDLALHQWSKQKDCRLIVMDGGEEGVKERCEKYSLQRIDGIPTGEDVGFKTSRFVLNSFFKLAREAVDKDCRVLTYANSDILVMNPGYAHMMNYLADNSHDFCCMMFRRINIVNWRKLLVDGDMDASVENIRADMWEHGTLNFPGIGDLTAWSLKAFDTFIDGHPVVGWDLLGIDRLWLTRHIDIGYDLYDLSWTVPNVHLYHVQDHWQPDEKYATQFVRKVWPELWCLVQQQTKLLDNGVAVQQYIKKLVN
jgi:hypothetical protein